ncbi:hypothetical protein [Alkalimarinus alittae]|uniref:Tellurite resistance methyltransferase TehB-like domain-containing protein n=1 Tax=Alkalimarinus alittae TaxID=2961619 RepID=A0ABY6N301_9ALTE|nr:hypothetical protein [Alkalimarinus alittae]UZE96491.1 hypothetical protein NKI27_01710 [Alkalimarinus alittae]
MHSSLIEQYVSELEDCARQGHIIDVACGEGRNGLFLTSRDLPVTFADKSATSLAYVSSALNKNKNDSNIWPIDLEQPDQNPFKNKTFSAALVFRYLHRPLIPHLLNAVIPGGIIIYETFTLDNKQFGRPNNPEFLLQPNELKNWFNDWETLHYFEGILSAPDRAVAQIVCRKPNDVISNRSRNTNTTNNSNKRANGHFL